MSERNLYGSGGEFVGSVDDDGRIYDNRHSFMGRIENGTIYDNCNIPQGRITDSGMVLDNHRQEVGQEYGTGFCSPGPRREMGTVRADILSEGHGSDYGAFHLLDRNQRHRYDPYPYDDNDNDGTDEDDDDWGDDFTSGAMPSYTREGNRQWNSQSDMGKNIDGCFDALGGCVGVIFLIVMLYQLIKYCGS